MKIARNFVLFLVLGLLGYPQVSGAQISDAPGVTVPSTSSPTTLPTGVTLQSGISYDSSSPSDLLDAYLPKPSEVPAPAVVLIHGGGWVSGSRTDLSSEAARFAAAGFAAFTIDYRLEDPGDCLKQGPEGSDLLVCPAANPIPWVDPIEDAQTAVMYVIDNASDFNINPKRVGVLGASAGGWIAGMLATIGLASNADAQAETISPAPSTARLQVAVTWSGIFDLTTLQPTKVGQLPSGCAGDANCIDKFAPTGFDDLTGCTLQQCPQDFSEASPVTHVTNKNTPLYMFNSAQELVPVAQPQEMAAALSKVGVANNVVILPGEQHAQEYFDQAWDQTLAYFTQYLGNPLESPPTTSSPTTSPSQSNTTKTTIPWLLIGAGVLGAFALVGIMLIVARSRQAKNSHRQHKH